MGGDGNLFGPAAAVGDAENPCADWRAAAVIGRGEDDARDVLPGCPAFWSLFQQRKLAPVQRVGGDPDDGLVGDGLWVGNGAQREAAW